MQWIQRELFIRSTHEAVFEVGEEKKGVLVYISIEFARRSLRVYLWVSLFAWCG